MTCLKTLLNFEFFFYNAVLYISSHHHKYFKTIKCHILHIFLEIILISVIELKSLWAAWYNQTKNAVLTLKNAKNMSDHYYLFLFLGTVSSLSWTSVLLFPQTLEENKEMEEKRKKLLPTRL